MVDVIRLFLDQAARRGDHAAVVEAGRSVTYQQLAVLAHQVAAAIMAHRAAARVLVAAPSGSRAYAAMFGTLLAGGFYSPINVNAPVAKQRLIVERFRPDVIVGDRKHTDALLEGVAGVPVIDLDSLPPPITVDRLPSAHDLAYTIFTSGSTGVPKGVMIPRSALACYVDWVLREMAVSPDDRWSQHPNIGFDLSVLDIYGALCGGATLYPLSEREGKLAPANFIQRHKLTVWNSVPSVVDIMLSGRQLTPDNIQSLRLMTFCGEPLLPHHVASIFEAHPTLSVHNTYGPTEATVSCTLLRLTAANYQAHCSSSVGIGEPIAGTTIHLVGGDGPDEGEIVIAGAQLARGYWDDPTSTAKVFRSFVTPSGAIVGYHTGDWANRVDGRLYFRNRVDFQVKISGFRLELDEVAAAIRRVGAAGACCALVEGELHAFVQPGDLDPDAARLRTTLAQYLESHAIPRWIHFLDALPRNANDKIDVGALIDQVRSGALVGAEARTKA